MAGEMIFFEYYEAIPREAENILFNGLNKNADERKGMRPVVPYGIFVKDAEGAILGGIEGYTIYGCLHIDMFWLSPELRHNEIGSKLIKQVEAIARERGCSFATVNTMDWEALSFYERLGFAIEFVREGYDKGSKMYLLRKKILYRT